MLAARCRDGVKGGTHGRGGGRPRPKELAFGEIRTALEGGLAIAEAVVAVTLTMFVMEVGKRKRK